MTIDDLHRNQIMFKTFFMQFFVQTSLGILLSTNKKKIQQNKKMTEWE